MENHSTSILMILVHTCSPHKSQLTTINLFAIAWTGGEGFKIVIWGGGSKLPILVGIARTVGETISVIAFQKIIILSVQLQSNRMFPCKQHCNIVPQYCNFDRQIALSNLQQTRTNCKLKFTKNLQTKPLIKLLAKRKPINSPWIQGYNNRGCANGIVVRILQ